MEALFSSFAIVALAEIGDKTQLLAMLLAARYRRPVPIIGGILVATLANHALAALLGSVAAGLVAGMWFQIAIGLGFVAMGVWTLIPDKLDEDDAPRPSRFGPFVATTLAFFIVEMGDKTQVATIALGARFHDVALVTAGTTLGMLAANVPAVLAGHRLMQIVSVTLMHRIAAALFLVLGAWTIWAAMAWRPHI